MAGLPPVNPEPAQRAIRPPTALVALTGGFVVIWVIASMLPFLWTLWGSFKVGADFFGLDWMHVVSGEFTKKQTGTAFTGENYARLWIEEDFLRAAVNTVVVTLSVVVISLTFGVLGGYALARSRARYAFWILIVALVFRAMPHIALVTGYLYPFFQLGIWGYMPTAIIVLVAINQPFTIWMLRSFFLNVPTELDESALVDGCNRVQAFWHVIMPVMWPGVITTGLFSFLLAYNDFTVTVSLLSSANHTMIPKLESFLGTVQIAGDRMNAVAAAVSATVPLFFLVMFFQRQLVSGLTQGAVKG